MAAPRVVCMGGGCVLHANLHHLVADVDEVYLVGVNGELCLASAALLMGYHSTIGGVEGYGGVFCQSAEGEYSVTSFDEHGL